MESKYTLDGLDGLTVWHQSRLEEEDIENIPNMATADIVDLLVNTRFPAGRIIDWVDQAILLTYLRESTIDPGRPNPVADRLARHGVRTASSLLRVDAVRGADAGWFGDPVEAGSLDIRSLIAAVRTSPNLALVLRWRGRPDADDTDADHPDPESEGSLPARPTTPSRPLVAAGVALASTMLLAVGRFRARRRTVVTDPQR